MFADTFEELAKKMCEVQLKRRGIKDEKVLDAMLKTPRHLFVPQDIIHRAYDDCALPIGQNQTISQPYMVAIMTELLELTGSEKVLELGTGSGYQSAILSLLAKEVYTIERIEALKKNAETVFDKLGLKNIKTFLGDGTEGLPEHAPFDRVIITAASEAVPPPLYKQLAQNAIIIAPLGDRYLQTLTKIIKKDTNFTKQTYTGCVFVPLIGKHAFRENTL